MNYRKKLFFLFFFFLIVFLFAEDKNSSKDNDSLPDESGISLNSPDKETEDKDKIENNSETGRDETGFDLSITERNQTPVLNLLRVLISLVIVCVLAYIVLKFLKKSSTSFSSNDPYLKSVASISLAQGKSIHVITLGEKAYIVGVTDSSINIIGEVEDKTLIDTMNFEADRRNSVPKQDFTSMLASIFKNSKNNKIETIDADFFAAQRERLNNASQKTEENE